MSTVVGIIQDGAAYIGSDSLATTDDGYRRNVGLTKKAFKLGPYLIGFIGSPRAAQLVMKHMDPPPENVYEFPDLLLELFREYDCLVQDDNGAVIQQCNFLIATHEPKMYEILCDFQINEVLKYTAIGSGSHFAFGSLHTTVNDTDAKERIQKALKAAAFFDSCTGHPLSIEQIGLANPLKSVDSDTNEYLKFIGSKL